jgi:NADH-quinone oxidoreductase subunit F
MQLDFEALTGRYRGRGRDALLPLLWDVQTAHGHISAEAVHAVSKALRVPEADIYGVITFYSLFHDTPTGARIVRVCADPSCALAGADNVLRDLEARSPSGVTVERSTCLGLCDCAPAALVSVTGQGEIAVGRADVDTVLNVEKQSDDAFHMGASPAVLLDTATHGDYAGLRRALAGLTPDEVIAGIEKAGLIGRGGAAFPTGLKWRLTRQAAGSPKYLICNADESEPGTFKDRVLMERFPHRLLEGMALAAYAIGAQHGYLFIRGEYPLAESVMRAAIADAEARGLLGANILGTGFTFHVEIRRGAGAYICGEETALFEAIEGKRGFPRIKPPYPTTHGVFGQPTVVNNVETLSAVPAILTRGADWFASLGTDKSRGTKLVSVSGHVMRPGVYEVTPGISLRALLTDHCGGISGDLQAVLMGGASGTFLTPADLDVPLTFEDLRARGSTFGSGAIMVFNTTVDLRDVLRRLAHFFQHESCGKCFPCQLGTQRQREIIERIDTPHPGDVARLLDVGQTMTEASLCGLGQTAGAAVMSAIRLFPHVFGEEVPHE